MYDKCRRCGKKLTDPVSMERGYGPVCWYQKNGSRPKKVMKPVKAAESHNAKECGSDDIPGQMNIFDYL